MSLDVTLITDKPVKRKGTGIFARRKGATVELTATEAKRIYPDAKIRERKYTTCEVFTANITHNLADMAMQVGPRFYQALWRPEEMQAEIAMDLIETINAGIQWMEANPERYKKFNPANGWGDFDQLLAFAKEYEEACRKYPTARIEVSR